MCLFQSVRLAAFVSSCWLRSPTALSLRGFVQVSVAVPVAHGGVVFLALSPTQVRGQSGRACVLPRGDSFVQARVWARDLALTFPLGYVVAVASVVLQGLLGLILEAGCARLRCG